MLYSLQEGIAPVRVVGGKAASLMKLYSSKVRLEETTRFLPQDIFEPVPPHRGPCCCCCSCFDWLFCCCTFCASKAYRVKKGLKNDERICYLSMTRSDTDKLNVVQSGCVVRGKPSKGWFTVKRSFKVESSDGISQHVPGGFALSVDFFNPWVDQVVSSDAWREADPKLSSPDAPAVCEGLKVVARELPLTSAQAQVLEQLKAAIGSWPGRLAAVRSSAPEEDGAGSSFAGIFETKLGVTAATLEGAVRECFASVFDHRVFSYAGVHRPAFAAVVMEMVDSHKAGVAFSANPLNSDLDEIMVDSSWGLGESVVDGSVVADRFVYNKVAKQIIEQAVGSKVQERVLLGSGGVEIRPVDEARQKQCTLSEAQVRQLADLIATVEAVYGMPMDTEWAYTREGQLRLLQARPITTIFPMDPAMITPPGEKRVLYYDANIASEATTTSPFTHMDLEIYFSGNFAAMGADGISVPEDPNQIVFNSATRCMCNYSHLLQFPGCNSEALAKEMELIDPYQSKIFRGTDCDDSKYKSAGLPREVTCCNVFALLRKIPFGKMKKMYDKFQKDPISANRELKELKAQARIRLKKLAARGPTDEGLAAHVQEVFRTVEPMLNLQMGGIWTVLAIARDLDRARLGGKTEKERQDAEALLGGYVGDPLMEINQEMYKLARQLPREIWNSYDGRYEELAELIRQNIGGESSELPKPFLDSWTDFMDKYGFDGKDQLFISSSRYVERPDRLLAKLRNNIGEGIQDPEVGAKQKLTRRQNVQDELLAAASCWSQKRIRQRNLCLDEIMWIRNAPKLSLAEVYYTARKAVLACEAKLLADGRLDEAGDVFHLKLTEADEALKDPSLDIRQILAPRKEQYLRALRSNQCPYLVDSRCRILKPNVVQSEPGTLVGAAISPGVAEGTVRFLTSPTERLERGEILVTVVTDPAWTPLFVGCAGVILQVGGALQHGALCAREYGKPAVSGIDVIRDLTTGMRVSVDGNTGVVKILDTVRRRPSRHLSSDEQMT